MREALLLSLRRMSQANGHEQGESYLLLRSGSRRFALPAGCVRRVVRKLALHPVPGGRSPFMGLALYAGEALVVLDLLALVGGGDLAGMEPVTVVLSRQHAGGRSHLGLAVREALNVRNLSDDEVEGELRGPIRGVFQDREGEIEIVDPARIGRVSAFDAEAIGAPENQGGGY